MQVLSLKLKGLYTDSSNLGKAIPDGALEKATNINIDSDDIAEVRRGFSRLIGGFSDGDDRAEKYFIYQDQLLASYTGDKLAWYIDNEVTGNVAASSNLVSNIASTSTIKVGHFVEGTGIPANTKVTAVAANSINLSNVATVTTNDLDFYVSGWIDYTGSHAAISSTFKIQATEANENFYYTTDGGVQKLSAYNDTTSVDAGIPRGLNISGVLQTNADAGFFAINSQVAYRVVWGFKDANNNVILGAPSNQTVVINPAAGSVSDVVLTINIPSSMTVSHFVQIYRSKGSALATISPTEEMQLVYEANPTAAEIAALTMNVTDSRPYAMMGAFLYTSPSEEGIGQANEVPPYSRCIATFKESVFYGNTTGKQRLNLSMIGLGQELTGTSNVTSTNLISSTSLTTNSSWVGALVQQSNGATNIISANSIIASVPSSSSISLNQTIAANMAGLPITITPNVTIAGVTYRPRRSEVTANNFFNASLSGAYAYDIAQTAQSLTKIINATTSQTNVYAYYISSVDDLPGQLLIEERDLGGSAFSAITPVFGGEWSPSLPASGTTVISTSERQKNGIYFSKYQEPEAVPLLNKFRVGSAAKEILKMVPVRDSLFILKEDGIWRILGADAADFRLEVVDLSTVLRGPETAQELNNQLFALTDQGVVIITETGVSVVSKSIEGDLLELFGSSLATIKTSSFAIGYKTDRCYLLFIVSGSDDSYPTQCYRYNTLNSNWTRWDTDATAGILSDSDELIYLGDGGSEYTLQERKSYDYSDHIDEKEQIDISANSSTSITVSDASNFRVGDILYQSSTVFSKVTAVDTTGNILTVERDGDEALWTHGAVSRFAYIPITIEWMPQSGDNPGVLKLFKDVSTFVTDRGFDSFTLSFRTELSTAWEDTTVSGDDLVLWGLFPWGSLPWPGGETTQGTFRTYTPLNKARGGLLYVKLTSNVAFRNLGIQGLSIPFEKGNEWTKN